MAQRCTYCGKTRAQHKGKACVDVEGFKRVLRQRNQKDTRAPAPNTEEMGSAFNAERIGDSMTKELHPGLGSGALREALERCMVALDDWLNTYASDLCDEKRVKEAYARIKERGTIGYITDVQEQARRALSLSSPIEPPHAEFPSCARCQQDKIVTVRVLTGFAGEFEYLCGECVSKEYANYENKIEAATPQASSEIRERVQSGLQALRDDSLSNYQAAVNSGRKFAAAEHSGYTAAIDDALALLAPSRQGAVEERR